MDDPAALRAENARLREDISRLERDLATRDSRNTIVGMKELVLTIGSSDRIVDINSTAERFFGIRREEVLGLPVEVLSCPPVEGSTLRSIADRARRTRERISETVSNETSSMTVTASPTPEGIQFMIADAGAQRTRTTLGGYLSPTALESLGRVLVDPAQARRNDCSAVVISLRGDANIPTGVEKTLRDEWIQALCAVVLDTGATVEGFSGGRLTALFGVPLPVDDHPLWAVNTLFRLKDAHRTLAAAWSRRGLPMFRAGFGIDSGDALWCQTGIDKRVGFSAIGRPIERAGILAALAPDDEVIASGRAFDALRGILERRPDALWRPAKFKRGDLVRLNAGEELSQTILIAES